MDGVARVVERAVEHRAGGTAALDGGGVRFGVGPVLVVGAEGVRGVGEGDEELEAAGCNEGRIDGSGHFVAIRMRDGGDMDGDTIDLERAGKDATPEVKFLVDVFEVG